MSGDVYAVAPIGKAVAAAVAVAAGCFVVRGVRDRGEFARYLDSILVGVVGGEGKFFDGDVEGAELVAFLKDFAAGEKVDC